MTDRLAIILGLLIIAVVGLDIIANDGRALMFALRKFADFIEYISFWR
jgi:hypothetical protein